VLILENRSQLEATAAEQGVSKEVGSQIADAISSGSQSGENIPNLGGKVGEVAASIPHDFAVAMQTVFYSFAGVMALAFVVALVFMPAGKVTEPPSEDEADQTPTGVA
ncbi:MAG TPA: hypothetical protein VEB65_10905, partial [Solirubrobacterales bacterium]|nr:hypothetical protein [Solirubrobacterales bacterium]